MSFRKSEIHALMGELAAKGAAILMISSELPEILDERQDRCHEEGKYRRHSLRGCDAGKDPRAGIGRFWK